MFETTPLGKSRDIPPFVTSENNDSCVTPSLAVFHVGQLIGFNAQNAFSDFLTFLMMKSTGLQLGLGGLLLIHLLDS